MKYQTLLKSFFSLAILFSLCTSTYIAYASEVTGNLSAFTPTIGQNTGGTISGTISGSTGKSSGGGSTFGGGGKIVVGEVLGASTASTFDNSFSSDGAALKPSSGIVAFGYGKPEVLSETTSLADLGATTPDPSNQFATAVVATDGKNAANWLWIVLLILFLIISAAYLYNKSRTNKTNRLP